MKVAVFGSGTMGAGIAELFASHEHTVLVYASSVPSAQKHREKLNARLDSRVARGKLTHEKKQSIMEHIFVEEKFAATDADLVLETIKEDMAVKRDLLFELDELCKPGTVFATNTSALSITEMSLGLSHPLIGMHFFFPVTAMKLVEIICGAHTPQTVFDFVKELAEQMGKEPVKVEEAPGFIVNRLIDPLINDAIRLVETGVASVEDVDRAMVFGLNHPIGPLTLADSAGLDVILSIMETLYKETGDPHYAPALLLRKMVRAGKLGRKTGEGFYSYRK